MVELRFDPKINIMWLKFGKRVPYGVNIHQKKAPSIGKLFFPFWGIFVPTPGKIVRGLKMQVGSVQITWTDFKSNFAYVIRQKIKGGQSNMKVNTKMNKKGEIETYLS